MKKILLFSLTFLLFACNNEYVMQANLIRIHDETMGWYEPPADYPLLRRSIRMIYRAINESSDSIFIPIGYPYDDILTANIESRKSPEISTNGEECYKRKGGREPYFASGDTIFISLHLLIDAKTKIDSVWMKKIPTKKLVSETIVRMPKPTKGKDADKIPTITFNNDTNDICINPRFVNVNGVLKVVWDK